MLMSCRLDCEKPKNWHESQIFKSKSQEACTKLKFRVIGKYESQTKSQKVQFKSQIGRYKVKNLCLSLRKFMF